MTRSPFAEAQVDTGVRLRPGTNEGDAVVEDGGEDAPQALIGMEAARDTSKRLETSLALSENIQQMAAQLAAGPSKEVLKSFRICTSCAKYRRLGELHDGGYLACMDGLESGGLKAAYSLGVEYHDEWSMDVYNLFHVPVYQFDCTVEGPAQNCPECKFFKVCLKGASGEGAYPGGTNWDLAQMLEQTHPEQPPRGSLLMKMDIEGAEWPILADGGADLTKFKQLILEFHGLSKEEHHAQYLTALNYLRDAGFRVSHIHGNNCCGMYEKNGYAIPDIIEVTFLLDSPDGSCKQDQEYLKLDQTNIVDRAELPPAHLPKE